MADASRIAAAHVASANDAYAPLAAQWAAVDLTEHTEAWSATLASGPGVVWVAASLDGFVHGGPARRTEPGVSHEVYAIHVLPAQRGTGLGAALWTAIRDELGGALYVDTLAELPCCRFYERHGGERIEERPTDFRGAARTHVTYRFR
ncbi:MAG: GNAT family N-acetyltransferase [Labilithrix sp.]